MEKRDGAEEPGCLKPSCSLHSNKRDVAEETWEGLSCYAWDFRTSLTHTLQKDTKQNTTYDFFKVLSDTLSWLEPKFHLMNFIICKYLTISYKHYS